MTDRKILVAFKCDRDLWFKWKTLAHSHGVTVEAATEILISEKLKGLEAKPEDSPSMKFVGRPGLERA